MKTIQFESVTQIEKDLTRPTFEVKSLFSTIETVFEAVKKDGDHALVALTQKFDGITLSPKDFLATEPEFLEAEQSLSTPLKTAIGVAYKNIQAFHQVQLPEIKSVETMQGVSCKWAYKPIQKIGLYIPGGSAPLFSTVLMLSIPAKIAGCKDILLCTPPNKEGKIHPAILYTAKLCGINKIYKIGGSQAIAAFTFGTATIPKVFKIFGPGNQYVTAAKQMASLLGTAIDMPAGPSEVMVVGDASSDPSFVASDLLSQAEHGIDSQVVLVTWYPKLIESVKTEIETQLKTLSRQEIAKKALENAVFVLVKDQEEALKTINVYAPEHLILALDKTDFFVENTHNAGSVFIGHYTPESAGDYASGTNHTLPTNGYAKQYSGVSVHSFMKSMTYQKITQDGLINLGPHIEIMAENEELTAHKNAVTLRLQKLIDKPIVLNNQ